MSLDLKARTEPGRRLVSLAEALANEIAPRAAANDRAARFPFESFTAVKQSGYLAAPIPEALGGLGVTSVHDVLVASSRLARGDAALTLGVNMHLVFVLNVVRRWQISTRAADGRRSAPFAATLERIARDGTVFAAAGSELGQDLTRPATTATRTEQGWVVSGRKVFCTMAAAADVLYTAVSYTDDRGSERYGYAMIPRETPGVAVHDDWDALGMRASGATPSPSRTSSSRPRRSAAGSPSATRSSTWNGISMPGSSTRQRRSASRRAHTRALPTSLLVAASSMPIRRCSQRRTSSTSPPAAPCFSGQRR